MGRRKRPREPHVARGWGVWDPGFDWTPCEMFMKTKSALPR